MKNKFNILRIISASIVLIGIIFIILGFVFNYNSLYFILGVSILFFGGILYALFTYFSRRYCDKCGHKLVETIYEYNILSTKESYSQTSDEPSLEYKVKIKIICPFCQEHKIYNARFTCLKNENIEERIKEYTNKQYEKK